MSQTNTFGADYKFGFVSSDAPDELITAGFTARTVASSDASPESFVTATNGEGLVESVAITKKENRMLTISLTGYVASNFNRDNVPNVFTFRNRVFFTQKISDPVPKGSFVEATIDASSYALITSTVAN